MHANVINLRRHLFLLLCCHSWKIQSYKTDISIVLSSKWKNGRRSTCHTLSFTYTSFFFSPLSVNPPFLCSLWKKQMTLCDRFQSINFQLSHHCAIVWVQRPPLNQQPEGCHFHIYPLSLHEEALRFAGESHTGFMFFYFCFVWWSDASQKRGAVPDLKDIVLALCTTYVAPSLGP